MNAIAIDNVSVVFNAEGNEPVNAVSEATLDVRAGEIAVLMGLSGSGKSTLLRCINGLVRPAEGRVMVTVNGQSIDVASANAQTLRRLRSESVSMVFQQFGLLPWRTVRENVALGLELRGESQRAIRKRVEEQLALVHLEEWGDHKISQLSGGMQQRVGLARALATDAEILLLDEPFSALDPLIRVHLQDELLSIQQELKRTMVFVSHDLDEALKMGNSIAIMEAGRIVQSGTPEDIVLRPVNEYVERFVANMNPLNVLHAGSVMTPVDADAATRTVPGDEHPVRIDTSANGMVQEVQIGGAHLAPHRDPNSPGAVNDSEIVVTSPDTPLRDVIAYKRHSPHPIVVEDDGKLAGLVTENDIYERLLNPGQPSEDTPPQAP